MPQRMSDILAARAHRTFVGRDTELGALETMLMPKGPRVLHVHGIAGIGSPGPGEQRLSCLIVAMWSLLSRVCSGRSRRPLVTQDRVPGTSLIGWESWAALLYWPSIPLKYSGFWIPG